MTTPEATTPAGSAWATSPLPGPEPGGPPPAVGRRRRRTYDDLDLTACHQLLADHHVGRVAWSAADGPQLFPVSYVWVQESIIFRTSPYGILSELVRRTPVVFEVDEIDQPRRRGWSVIVRGLAGGVASLDRIGGSSVDAARPWAGGNRHLIIAVTAQHVTGRTFYPADGADPFP